VGICLLSLKTPAIELNTPHPPHPSHPPNRTPIPADCTMVFTAVATEATVDVTRVDFHVSICVPILQGMTALPVDASNIGVACRPLQQTGEVKASQVFAGTERGVSCSVTMSKDDYAHMTFILSDRAVDAQGNPFGFDTLVPGFKIYVPGHALAAGLRTKWSVQDSNGGGVELEATIQVDRGFDIHSVLAGTRPENVPARAHRTLMQGAQVRSDCMCAILHATGGDDAALSMMAGQMFVNAGVVGPPLNQRLLSVSDPRMTQMLGDFLTGAQHNLHAAPAACKLGRRLRRRARRTNTKVGMERVVGDPRGTTPPSDLDADEETAPPQSGLYDPSQVAYIHQCLVEQGFRTYLYMAMPVVYGVAAKISDHISMPLCANAQQMQKLDKFISAVETNPEWAHAIHKLFETTLAEAWCSRTVYSMDPAMKVALGQSGARLVLQGPGEVQDILGQKGVSSRWFNAQRVGLNTAWNGVGAFDCEDGASFIAAVQCAIVYATERHSGTKEPRRDMFDTMHEIMPTTDQHCLHTQRCAARLLLITGRQMLQSVRGVSYVAASAADAASAAGMTATDSGNAKTCSAISATWARLVGTAPSAGGHAVSMKARTTKEKKITVSCGDQRVRVGVSTLIQATPLESTALVIPAPTDEAPELYNVSMEQGTQESQRLSGHGTSVSMSQCQSMCSAALAMRASMILPTDSQACPVFVQAPGTPGFYIGAYCIGNHILVTEDASSTGMTDLLNSTKTSNDAHVTVDQGILSDITKSVQNLTLPQILTRLEKPTTSTWSTYNEMGAGVERNADDGYRKVWALRPDLLPLERAMCEQIARHAAAEIPSVETLRAMRTAPLSSSEMRLHSLTPPGSQPPTRTGGGSVTPTPFIQVGMVPLMLNERNRDTGMPTHGVCAHTSITMLERLGAESARNITNGCAIGFFPLQDTRPLES